MAAKNRIVYICSNCGFESAKWAGKCPDCGEWNTMEESVKTAVSAKSAASGYTSSASTLLTRPLAISEIDTEDEHRYHTGLSELDRVLGGGLVKGSLVLISGDPGIGKSTILLQICEYLGQKLRILYVSGEESARQIKLRAGRLGVSSPNLRILAETDVQLVVEHIRTEKPDIVMIDSIQTMNFTDLNSSPGSVTQVRECTNAIMRCSKSLDIPAILVGHVNKDGAIAGPKVLEHIVDAVLYFEGDRQMTYRILRAVKNRYGSTNEIGVFDMGEAGLRQIENPSQVMLEGRPIGISGTCVACVMEGTRPVLSEIQALVTKTAFPSPRRTASGFDYNRMYLLLAVLEKRAGYVFGNQDVYINIIGGLKLDETACDLPVCLAMASSLLDLPVPEKTLAIGEVGLGGEVRSVPHLETRLREAQRVGFDTAIVPKHNLNMLDAAQFPGLRLVGVAYLREAINAIKINK